MMPWKLVSSTHGFVNTWLIGGWSWGWEPKTLRMCLYVCLVHPGTKGRKKAHAGAPQAGASLPAPDKRQRTCCPHMPHTHPCPCYLALLGPVIGGAKSVPALIPVR